MRPHFAYGAAVLLAAASVSATAQTPALQGPVALPPPKSLATTESIRVPYDKLMQAKALPEYHEPEWVTEFVKAGKLPPVAQRLPAEPIVEDMHQTANGDGIYGGILRHVSGGRPQGWNWSAGQTQGTATLDEMQQECLVTTGPMWQLTQDRIEPLPDLATSWEWSSDGHQLTMHLLKGAKWSDGQPFTADDIVFFWEDNVSDPNVPARVQPGVYGEGTKLEKLDGFTIRWTFPEIRPIANLYKMGFGGICPGPAHILKPLHPRYNKSATYDSYTRALGPDKLPWVTMGAWAVVDYKPDQIIVLRRNPFYFKVDERGYQLPYLDEVQFKLSSWADRTIQTVAGNADYDNLENPSLYLETIRKSQDPGFPNKIYWGPRSYDWHIDLNLSTVCGVEGARDQAIRDLNRKLEFRRAVSQGLDRDAMGQSLVRGPFTSPFPGGIHKENDIASPNFEVYYPYSPATSKALLAGLGFTEIGSDGYLRWSAGPLSGQPLEITLTHGNQRPTDPALADGAITMLREIGIKVIANQVPLNVNAVRDSCKWDWILDRGAPVWQEPIISLDFLAPLSRNVPQWHQGTKEKPQALLDFEPKLIDLVKRIRVENDTQKRIELFAEYNRLFTANIYDVGLITAAGAIVVSKRLQNIPPGTPVLAYQWGEVGVMRERLWSKKEDQLPELLPGRLPGVQ